MFDHAFDTSAGQEDVYREVGLPVLNNILDGFNGTIMAYGQTSSGKTHTMQGYDINDREHKGIIPRIVTLVLVRLKTCSARLRNQQIIWNSSSKSQSSKYIWKKSETFWMLGKRTSRSERTKPGLM